MTLIQQFEAAILSAYEMETSSLISTQPRAEPKSARPVVPKERDIEASRYALSQRLMPAIRHQVAGTFQPVMMMAAMLQKQLQSPSADLSKISAHCASMHGVLNSGATDSLACFAWLTPTERTDIGLYEGVTECLRLMATELALREFTIVNDLAAGAGSWPRDALRNVFMATLLALTDNAPSPARLVVFADTGVEGAGLTLHVHSADDAVLREAVPVYRKIEWLDAALLAEAEGVVLERQASGARLSLFPTR